MKIFSTLLLLSLLLPLCLLAQKGYNARAGFVITQQNDTLRGVIRDRKDLSESVMFKASDYADFQELTTNDIFSFGFAGGATYVAYDAIHKQGPSGKRFLLQLVAGKISLYKYEDVYFALKAGEETLLEQQNIVVEGKYKRTDVRYLGLLKLLTMDCPALQNKIERVKFNDVDLTIFFTEYNKIMDLQSFIAADKSFKVRIRKGGRLGVSTSRVTERDAVSLQDVDGSILNYTGGVFFNFSLKDKFSFQPEILITRKHARSSTVQFSVTNIQVPLSVYYTFPTGKLRPFLSAGYLYGKNLAEEVNTVYRGYNIEVPTSGNEYGYRGGAGILLEISESHRLGLEYIHERTLTNGRLLDNQFEIISNNFTLRYSF